MWNFFTYVSNRGPSSQLYLLVVSKYIVLFNPLLKKSRLIYVLSLFWLYIFLRDILKFELSLVCKYSDIGFWKFLGFVLVVFPRKISGTVYTQHARVIHSLPQGVESNLNLKGFFILTVFIILSYFCRNRVGWRSWSLPSPIGMPLACKIELARHENA